MPYSQDDGRFQFDPRSDERPSDGGNFGLAVLIGAGVLVLIALGLYVVIWRPFGVEGLGPREEESAEEKFREAADAFTSETIGTDEEELAEIHELFAALGQAFTAADGPKLGELFDVKRLYQEGRRLGAFEGIPARQENKAIEGLRRGLGAGLARQAEFSAYERFEIKRCKFLGDRSEAVVYVRHWRKDGISLKFRWWIKKRSGRWRVYDFEELSVALRMSNAMAMADDTYQADRRKLAQAKAEFAQLAVAMRAIAQENWDTAEQTFDRMGPSKLPGPLKAVRWMLQAVACVARGRAQEALDFCDRAEALHADMPALGFIRATALNGLGRHAEAKQMAEKFIEQLGGDVDGYLRLGEALTGLGRKDEAADAYRKGLEDDPDSGDCLVGLAAVLPEGKKAELGERLAKMPRLGEQFEAICETLLMENDLESLETVVSAYARVAPDEPDVAYYDAQLKYRRKDYEGAAATVKPVIAGIDDSQQRGYFVDLYLDSMVAAEKSLEAYRGAPDPDYAFKYLAANMPYGEQPEELKKLIAAHRANRPDDAWLDYYAGEAAAAQQQWDEAIKAYQAGMTKALDDETREEYRWSLVYVMFEAGKALEAHAQIKPTHDVFIQLARLAAAGGDTAQLAALIKAHRKKYPGDVADFWDAELSWIEKDYAAVVRKLEPLRGTMPPAERDWQFNDRLIRSLIHLKKFDEALRETEQAEGEDDDPWFRTMVHAACGEVRETLRGMDRCMEQGYEQSEFYADSIIGPALRSDEFAEVRKKYPEPANDDEK